MVRTGEGAGCGDRCAEDCSCLWPSWKVDAFCNGRGVDKWESYSHIPGRQYCLFSAAAAVRDIMRAI